MYLSQTVELIQENGYQKMRTIAGSCYVGATVPVAGGYVETDSGYAIEDGKAWVQGVWVCDYTDSHPVHMRKFAGQSGTALLAQYAIVSVGSYHEERYIGGSFTKTIGAGI